VLQSKNTQVQAFYALRTAMGLQADSTAIYRPTDALPESSAATPAAAPSDLVARARTQRLDVQSARELVAAAAADLRGAQWNTKPNLDLNASIGYTGLLAEDGVVPFVRALGSNVPGVNASVGLALELPVHNTARASERDAHSAAQAQAQVTQADLERRVQLDALSALEELRLSLAALQASDAAVASLSAAFEDEQERMRSREGTVIDLLLTQDRLIAAQLSRVDNHLRYAVARVRLAFQLGELPAREDAVPSGLHDLSAKPTP
jgi:outer membrane protein TolC